MQIMIVSLCALILAMLSPAGALADAPPVGNTEQQVINLIQRAENMCDTGRPEEALPLLSAAAELKPDAADIYRVWGCVRQAGRVAQSRGKIQEAGGTEFAILQAI
jgi:hypothetical protein